MKKFLMFFCTVMLVFGMIGTASAISYTDTYDAGGLYMSSHLSIPDDSVSWTFDITNDGFNPATQDVTSASISLNFTDDGGWELWELADLNVGANTFSWEVNTGGISFTITSLMTLSNLGTIDCTLIADAGDFYFNSARLNAEGTDPGSGTAPVSEPATILLMGVGLLGLAGFSRKRLNKKS